MISVAIFKGSLSKTLFILLSFFLAKAIAFLGPIWLANNSTIVFYGEVEFYLSLLFLSVY